MAINLSGIFGDVGNLASSISMQDIVASIATGAIGTVVLSGAKTKEGGDALDPLHIFHHADGNVTGAVQGNVMVASQFAKLDPATQATLLNAHYTIIPG